MKKSLSFLLPILFLLAFSVFCIPAFANDVLVSAPENEAPVSLSRVDVLSDADYCTKEIGSLFGADVRAFPFDVMLTDETSEQTSLRSDADAVVVLTTVADVSDANGKLLNQSELRKVVNRLRTHYDPSIPIIWDAVATREADGSAADLYRMLDNLEHSNVIRNLHAGYTFQGGGDEDRLALARRATLPFADALRGAGTETPVFQDIVYYISETGSQAGNGLTPASAVQTVPQAVSLIKKRYGSLNGLPAGSRIVFEITGSVQQTKTQQFFGMGAAPKDLNGNRVPILCETYDYQKAADNRAEIRCEYLPHDDGSARAEINADVEFRNLKLSSVTLTSSNLTCHYLFATNSDIVFDNVTFESGDKRLMQISPCNNVWMTEDDVPAVTVLHSHMTFKNGYYGESTGVDFVTALNTPYLWRTLDQGGSIYEGYQFHNHVVVSEGAVVEKVYAMATYYKQKGLPTDGSDILVEKGGVVNHLAVSPNKTKTYDYFGPVVITVDGGSIGSSLSGLGAQSTLTGDLTITLRNTKIKLTAEGDDSDSAVFGREMSILMGNALINVENCLLEIECGLNVPSSFRFIGKGNTINGSATETIRNTTILMLPNEKLTNPDASLSFGLADGTVNGYVKTEIGSSLIDVSKHEDRVIRFIGENAAIGTEYGDKGDEAVLLTVFDSLVFGDARFLPEDGTGKSSAGSVTVVIDRSTMTGECGFETRSTAFSGPVSILLRNSRLETVIAENGANSASGYTLKNEGSSIGMIVGLDEPGSDETEKESESESAPEVQPEKTGTFPWWIPAAAGGVLLIALIVILITKTKKKKAS